MVASAGGVSTGHWAAGELLECLDKLLNNDTENAKVFEIVFTIHQEGTVK